MTNLNPVEALRDFFKTANGKGLTPKLKLKFNFYRAIARGTAKDAKGKVVVPTGKRVRKFLDEFAPGQYTFHPERFTKNGPPD